MSSMKKKLRSGRRSTSRLRPSNISRREISRSSKLVMTTNTISLNLQQTSMNKPQTAELLQDITWKFIKNNQIANRDLYYVDSSRKALISLFCVVGKCSTLSVKIILTISNSIHVGNLQTPRLPTTAATQTILMTIKELLARGSDVC